MWASLALAAVGVAVFTSFPAPANPESPLARWGEHGHRMVGQAAAEALPAEMPAFFRAAAPQLSYLNYEPDRWRERTERALDPAMDAAHSPEHYINFERVPAGAFAAPNRYAYMDSLRAAGVEIPGPGLLPWRILEMTQRLRVQFRLWRAATDPQERAWIEQRILNDAGIMGHYVADGSNPHHTTIHHAGWVGPNPRGYATDREFHARFESIYVRHHIRLSDVTAAMRGPPNVFPEVRPAVVEYLRHSHSLVERLYEIDRRHPYGAETTAPENRQFAAERLAAGAEMLRDLWWTAWVTSAPEGVAARR